MRVLILSSRCTVEQRCALSESRAFLEGHGDTCEILDWLSFLSDTVSEINAHSRKLVRKHIQELLTGAFPSNPREEKETQEKGVRRLTEISAKELSRFIREGDYELVLCAEPVAAFLLRKASGEASFPALTVFAAADDGLRPQSGFDLILTRDTLMSDEAKQTTREKLERLAREKRQPAVKAGAPTIQSSLRHHILKMPEAVYEASGIVVNGRRLKSFVFSTDLAIIRNCDADAVFAVYPFTPQQAISEAIIKAAYVPVFCGVGGGTTKGGAHRGAGAAETPAIIRKIREQYPSVPIIASGGNTSKSIREAIRAGANAVTYTPPSIKEIFRVTMSKYRES